MFQFDKIQQKLFAIMAVIIVILTGTLFFREYNKKNDTDIVLQNQSDWDELPGPTNTPKQTEALSHNEPLLIKVYLTGQVQNPGIIELQEGDRVADAVKLAGGTLPEADLDRVNLALKVRDEGMYYIPKIGEEIPDDININQDSNNPSASKGKININTADSNQLQTLNGIGPAKAQKIIDYRQVNGEFKSIEEIMNVSGIGEKTFDALKDQIDIR